jgi:undecaprenyl-diphosphatase
MNNMQNLFLSVDLAIFSFINGFAGRSITADSAVQFIASNPLVKGIPIAMVIWGLWFATTTEELHRRSQVLALLVVSIVAIFLGRLLALIMPFRLRPIHEPTVTNIIPHGLSERTLDGWSSMPSDHAVMFFALAAGIALIHKGLGIFAAFYAILVISAPRIYLGFHFPSDLIVGAVVGIAFAVLFLPQLTRVLVSVNLPTRLLIYPTLFYPIFFLITFQLASMFDSAREFISAIGKLLIG